MMNKLNLIVHIWSENKTPSETNSRNWWYNNYGKL